MILQDTPTLTHSLQCHIQLCYHHSLTPRSYTAFPCRAKTNHTNMYGRQATPSQLRKLKCALVSTVMVHAKHTHTHTHWNENSPQLVFLAQSRCPCYRKVRSISPPLWHRVPSDPAKQETQPWWRTHAQEWLFRGRVKTKNKPNNIPWLRLNKPYAIIIG